MKLLPSSSFTYIQEVPHARMQNADKNMAQYPVFILQLVIKTVIIIDVCAVFKRLCLVREDRKPPLSAE